MPVIFNDGSKRFEKNSLRQVITQKRNSLMQVPMAIGFDLFNTLLTINPVALETALGRLIGLLHEKDIPVEPESFQHAYAAAAIRFIQEARGNGLETHNRFWISAALEQLGYHLSPEDSRIEEAVETYFSAFYPHCELLPGTTHMLEQLSARYPLGLLTNFTHPPAVCKIIDQLALAPFFKTILISGELGYCKPHSSVFSRLVKDLGVQADQILFVGDDPDADVQGAWDAGLQPVLTTCVHDKNIASAKTPLSPSRTDSPLDVPKISGWEELLSLLGISS